MVPLNINYLTTMSKLLNRRVDYRYRAITSKTRNIDLLELLSLGFSTSFWNWCNITVNVLILYGFVYRPGVNNCLVFPERIKPFTMMLLSIWKCDILCAKWKRKSQYATNLSNELKDKLVAKARHFTQNLLAPYICA